nr:PREDICTED: lipase 3-like [Tribolium castaneum]|eukprot:XP_015834988.1 PREDICTED: lipase 3-like [Tribolium castaneum]
MFLVIVLLGCLIQNSLSEYNNVCPTFEDYYTMRNNSNCWYDFTAEFDVPTVIRLNGYPVIEYRVPTADGFILTMFRIPSKNPKALKYPVYLQHGLVATCAYFVGLKRNSLAFVLADAGYDVWLGNYRGTQYSETHINKTVYQQDYWDHSMDEIVAYDFPASFNTILANTDPDGKIIYIGHSLGTTLSLMYAAEFPEVAKETLRMMVLISPAYTLANMKSPYRLAAPFGAAIMNIVGELEMFRIVSQAQPLKVLTDTLCLESPPLMQFCLQLYNLFYGPHTDFGPEMIPVYFNQLPGGTALKILNHAADLVLGNFRKYNYVDRNVLYYGTEEPPEYDIKKIQVPVYIIYSSSDWATTAPDAVNLWNHLSEEARFGLKNVEVFNHIDFVYGRHARSLVYDDLVQVLNKFVNS